MPEPTTTNDAGTTHDAQDAGATAHDARPSESKPSRKRSRLRRVAIALAAIIGALLVFDKVASIVNPAPAVGFWKSADHQARYEENYRRVMETLPAPSKTMAVQTRFGSVRVVQWDGKNPGEPVVLLPGHSSGAPMWADNLPHLIGDRTILALDPLGDAGFTTQRLPMTSPDDQAEWINEALQEVGVEKAHIVGHSFGGANAAALAARHPERVASLAMLEPVVVVRPMPASIYFWSAVSQIPVQSWRDRALAEIGGTTVEEVQERTPMGDMIDAATAGYSTALPMPRELSDDEWRGLTMPVRLDIGGQHSLAGGQGAADRMKELVPGAQVKVWPEGTHSLPMDRPEEMGKELTAFWDSH